MPPGWAQLPVLLRSSTDPSLALDETNSASVFLHGLCPDPMSWQPLYPREGGMGHCHNLLSLCHWHCAASSPDHATRPPSPQLFLSPPNCVSHCPILSGAVGAPGTQCPAPGGPAPPHCPLTLLGHREPCPGRLQKVHWGVGLGLAGALAPQGTPGDVRLWGWDGSSGQMVPSAMWAAGRDACPGKKGVLKGCRCRAAGFGEDAGSWLAEPPAPTLRNQLCPPPGRSGCRGDVGTYGAALGQG